jgi:hypothetical protein
MDATLNQHLARLCKRMLAEIAVAAQRAESNIRLHVLDQIRLHEMHDFIL